MEMSQSSRSFTLLNCLLLGKTDSSLLFVYKWAQDHGLCAFCLPCQFWDGIEVCTLCLARAALRIILCGLSWNSHGPVLFPLSRSHGWEAEMLLRLQEHSCSPHNCAPELGPKSFIGQAWRFPVWVRMGSDLYWTDWLDLLWEFQGKDHSWIIV